MIKYCDYFFLEELQTFKGYYSSDMATWDKDGVISPSLGSDSIADKHVVTCSRPKWCSWKGPNFSFNQGICGFGNLHYIKKGNLFFSLKTSQGQLLWMVAQLLWMVWVLLTHTHCLPVLGGHGWVVQCSALQEVPLQSQEAESPPGQVCPTKPLFQNLNQPL